MHSETVSTHNISTSAPAPASTQRITVDVKKRIYNIIEINIPYGQLEMIRVLQEKFNYEVKGTIYVDSQHKFKSFEVRTDSSETSSYGASDWKISFHTHPDNTAQKYGVRYYSPPSVDDVMEIYDHSEQFVPDSTKCGFGELSIIFANEGIYVLQVDRDNFKKYNKDNMPLDILEEILNQTLTSYLVTELKKGIAQTLEEGSVTTNITKKYIDSKVNMDNPDISIPQFTAVVKRVSRKVSETYGFNMAFHSWIELEEKGLTLTVCDYFLNKKVLD